MSEVLPPGTEIANYRVSRVLGRGGMGVVYMAEHVHLGRMAALKTISGVHADTPELRERFVRESRMAAQIDHPHIVPIYDAGEAAGQLYLAMRFVDGEDLDQLNERDAPLDPGRVLDVFDQVASALDAAHAQGLVHRDVKPANVLLEPAGPGGRLHAYLADFGLTKHADADSGLTATGQVMGTVFYVAPEQIEGREIDRHADQYSLGCMLFESLTGARPFDADSQLLAILHAHAHNPRPQVTAHRPDLPPAIDTVVARALAVSADERFATCGEFVAAARAALEGEAPVRAASAAGAPVSPEPEAAGAEPDPSAGAEPAAGAEPPAGAEPATVAEPSAPADRAATGEGRGQAAQTAPGVSPPPRPGGQAAAAAGETPRRRRGALTGALVSALVLAGAVAAAAALWPVGDGGDSVASDEEDVSEAAGDVSEGEGEDPGADDDPAGDDDSTGDEPAGGGTSPPEDPIVFTSDRDGDNDIVRVAPDGSEAVNLTAGSGADDRQATWSREGDRLVFASDRTGRFAIHTMGPDGGDVTQVTSGAGRDLDPRFSPNGEQIAFSSQRDDSRSIWVINVDGTGLERLTDAGGADMRPTWSNDGTRLAFHRVHGDDERLDVFVKEADLDAEPVNVTDRPARDFHPSWAPAEPLLTFASDQGGAEDIFTVTVTGVVDGDEPGTPRNLTESSDTDDLDPNWAPDAEWITFQRGRGDKADVYLMRADGSEVRPLTDAPSADADPDW